MNLGVVVKVKLIRWDHFVVKGDMHNLLCCGHEPCI